MTSLPASVRVALWATAALAGELPMALVVARALPDVDHVSGDLEQFTTWHDFGESAVLVALPRPGDVSGVPRGSLELTGAATDAGECVYVPGIGGALVPTFETYGPEGDHGSHVSWTAYDCEPTPTHRLEAVSLAEVELQLRRDLIGLTSRLEDVDGLPLGGMALRELAIDGGRPAQWGVPDGLLARALRIMTMAARVAELAQLGLDPQLQSVDASSTLGRSALLGQICDVADTALAAATNVACLNLAGLRQDRIDS